MVGFCTPPSELARRWLARWGRVVSGPSGAMDGGRRAPMDGLSASRTSLPHAGLSTSVGGEWITAGVQLGESKTMMASISTATSRGKAATPTAARAG